VASWPGKGAVHKTPVVENQVLRRPRSWSRSKGVGQEVLGRVVCKKNELDVIIKRGVKNVFLDWDLSRVGIVEGEPPD